MRPARLLALVTCLLVSIVALPAAAMPLQDAPNPRPCRDRLVNIIVDAGFKGNNIREAYAIVMRESNGENLGPGHPAFNGADWGIWQFNKPTWGGEPWWSDEAMLDPRKQSRIAKNFSRGGKDWRHWGISGDGQSMDTTYYGMWDADTQYAWIWEPYARYYGSFPKKCLSVLS